METNSNQNSSETKAKTETKDNLVDKEEKQEMSFREKRIRDVTFAYYSMNEIRKAILEFSKNRECIPRYFENFGKRPDNFQYENDILEYIKRGATSFHCSEELWSDSLEISTEMSKEESDELRIGWDLLLDIDSPYLEYSKLYAELVVETLKFYGIENIGIKFSGSKGFHIIIPWKAFPKEIYNQKTKNMFPEWPRVICEYLSHVIKPKLTEKILENENLKQIAKKTGREEQELIIKECVLCHRAAIKKFLITWFCSYCKKEFINIEGTYNNRKKSRCPDCRKELVEKSREEMYFCEFCNKNSKKNPEFFEEKERFATEKLIDADIILVSSRHLFRMPYSLHEKTALVSVVIDKNKVKDFQIKDAKPFNIEIKNFYPEAKENEAKHLLLQALDWKEQKDKKENSMETMKTPSRYAGDRKNKPSYKLSISDLTPNLYPPCIKLLLNGVKQDGRKRALFILINFFNSLGLNEEESEKIINEWNEKNYQPLKKGYIKSQINWHKKNPFMPPNCDKPNYRELGICKPDELCRKIKNPVSYSFRKFFGKNNNKK